AGDPAAEGPAGRTCRRRGACHPAGLAAVAAGGADLGGGDGGVSSVILGRRPHGAPVVVGGASPSTRGFAGERQRGGGARMRARTPVAPARWTAPSLPANGRPSEAAPWSAGSVDVFPTAVERLERTARCVAAPGRERRHAHGEGESGA